MRYFVRVDITVMQFRLEFAISYEIHSLHLEKYFFIRSYRSHVSPIL
jgi:hypothetical protein